MIKIPKIRNIIIPSPHVYLCVAVFSIALSFVFLFCPRVSNGATISKTPTYSLTSGLVGHWTFDGSNINWSTNTALDSSYNGYHGSITNMSTTTSPVIGKLGQALFFRNTNEIVSMGDLAFSDDANFSASVWAKANGLGSRDTLVIKKLNIGTAASLGWAIIIDNGSIRLYSADGTNVIFSSRLGNISLNRWYHIVGVVDWATKMQYLYVDGVLADSDSIATVTTIANDYNFRVGVSGGTSNAFDGTIDDVRLYNRMLTIGEIQQLYRFGEGTKTSTTIQSPVSSPGCTSGLTCGLVGHWTFDGKDMLTGLVRDVSGNNNHGSAVNMATTTARVAGKVGQGLKFDGVDDRINILHSASISPSEITIAFWMFPPTDFLAGKRIIDKGATEYLVRRVAQGNGNKIEFFPGGYTSQSAVLQGRWTHVTITASASGHRMYLNGNLDFSNAIAYSPSGTGTLRIGGATDFFPGDLDDVRIYNRVLSASEVLSLYKMGEGTKVASTPKPPTSSGCTTGITCGLVGHWTFDGKDMITGTVRDVSGNNNHGSAVNMATTTARVAGKVGQGLRFDGADDSVQLSYSLIGDQSALTTCGWFRYEYPGESPTRYDFLIGNSDYINWIDTNSYPLLIFHLTNDGSTIIGSNTFSATGWHHYCAVRDGSFGTIYIDGSLSGDPNRSIGDPKAPIWPVKIGEYTIGYNFHGIIDDVRVYYRALSATEVKQIYNLGR